MKITKIHTNEDADLLTEAAAKPAEAKPAPKSEVIELRIVKPCKNPRFVIADMDGLKVFVQCHPKFSGRIIRKTVKVQVTRNGEETTYQYLP